MDIYEIFNELKIEYQEIEHEPVFTIKDAQKIKLQLYGIGCKNLFLTDKKGKYIIAVLHENKKADLKKIQSITNSTRLSFASNSDLEKYLMLKQGSVSPFGIINDSDNVVLTVIDSDLKGCTLLFHPNINTKTVAISFNNLIRFIEHEKHEYLML